LDSVTGIFERPPVNHRDHAATEHQDFHCVSLPSGRFVLGPFGEPHFGGGVAAIASWRKPSTVNELRQALAMMDALSRCADAVSALSL
jgi:hypothetical protein